MKYFLAKTDPEEYSVGDLERDGRTVWDGVRNPQALKAVRAMEVGDRVFIYHSGGESEVVGLAKVVAPPRTAAGDGKEWVVEVEFVERLAPGVKLGEIKGSGRFGDWALVRQGRLSTMEAPAEFVAWMRERFPEADLP